MLKLKERAGISIDYEFDSSININKLLFFDIETTGFSRTYNIIYLIGLMHYENGELYVTQYLAENKNEEAMILQEFYRKLSQYDYLVHFNGNAFDIPFVIDRGKHFNMDFDFERLTSIDLYKKIKPFGKILKLENYKQKTIELLLDIRRDDPFSGGDLIHVYDEYVRTKDHRLLKALILHNLEDVCYMAKITSILSFTDFMTGAYSIKNYNISQYSDINGNIKSELIIHLLPKQSIPFHISYVNDYYGITGFEDKVILNIKIINDELKYFFDNYKDYYYLPEEDIAIHKSVASFVDKNHRTNATASNCYTKKCDSFIPVFANNNWNELFKSEYKSKVGWICLNKIDETNIDEYTQIILKQYL